MYEVNWTSEKGIISLVNAREVILTLKKGAILLVTHKKQLASRKERRSSPIWSEATLGDPSVKLPISEATQKREAIRRRVVTIPRRIYSNPNAELKARSNSTTKATFTFTSHQSKQFKVFQNLNHSTADSWKLWRGSCWHSKKDKIPNWPEQCQLVDIYKRQVTDKPMTSSSPISRGRISNLDSTDPVKQTVSQEKLVRRPKQVQRH